MTAKNTLSDEEFHQAALAGGASRHPETNEVPDRGYMVGGARDLSDMPFPEIKRPVDQFSLDDVRHHAREIRDRFGPAPVYQGAWKEGDSVVLDAAEKFTEKRRAVRTARKRGERAIYDVKGSKDIPTQ